jgi:hypothetical protein
MEKNLDDPNIRSEALQAQAQLQRAEQQARNQPLLTPSFLMGIGSQSRYRRLQNREWDQQTTENVANLVSDINKKIHEEILTKSALWTELLQDRYHRQF